MQVLVLVYDRDEQRVHCHDEKIKQKEDDKEPVFVVSEGGVCGHYES